MTAAALDEGDSGSDHGDNGEDGRGGTVGGGVTSDLDVGNIGVGDTGNSALDSSVGDLGEDALLDAVNREVEALRDGLRNDHANLLGLLSIDSMVRGRHHGP